MRRWSIELVAALVQLLCGLGFLTFALLSWAPFESWTLTAFVAIVTVAFLLWAWRTWRGAGRASRRFPAPSAPPPSTPTVPPSPATPGPAAPSTPTPMLSADDERELARIVAVLDGEGVFAAHPPNPADLSEAAADAGPPLTADIALAAMGEADYYHPAFRLADHDANLALHHSHGEQFAETLRDQAADLVRLAGGTAIPVEVDVREERVRLSVDGRVVEYVGATTYLSTVLQVELARALREHGSPRRLAWLWCDAGAWLTGLTEGGAERLNAGLGEARGEGWEWVDEQESFAAGDPVSLP